MSAKELSGQVRNVRTLGGGGLLSLIFFMMDCRTVISFGSVEKYGARCLAVSGVALGKEEVGPGGV